MATARIVLFGDTHLGFDAPARPRTDRRRRGDDFFANYRRVLDYVTETRPDVVVHGGDFFHRSRVPPAVVDQAFASLAAVADSGIPVLLVPGNHDRSRLPPSLWLGHPLIQVFDRPRTVHIGGPVPMALSGFPFAWGDLRQSFDQAANATGLHESGTEARFLCMHHTVAGATVGPNGYTFRAGRDTIARRQLPRSLTAVLAGHIHRAQVLEGDHPPVYYAGSTERTSFAERDETKGFYDLTVRTGNPGGTSVEASFVELPARPMVDLVLPPETRAHHVRELLTGAAQTCPADAVIRITAASPDTELLGQLSAAELRSVFPSTMNVQLGGGLFNAVR